MVQVLCSLIQQSKCIRRALAVGLLFGIGIAAAQQPRESIDRSTINPADQQILEVGDVHLGNSRVYVRVEKSGLGHEHGVSGRLRSGRIQWDVDGGVGELVFDMNSFVADTEQARKYVGLSGTTDADTQRKVTENMRGVEVLNVEQYPTARFQIKSIRKLKQTSRRGMPLYQLDGEFTLQRATRPIQIVAEAEQKSGWIHLIGNFSILQSDFGMTPYSRAFGAVGVADALQIWGDLWIAQQRMAIRAGRERSLAAVSKNEIREVEVPAEPKTRQNVARRKSLPPGLDAAFRIQCPGVWVKCSADQQTHERTGVRGIVVISSPAISKSVIRGHYDLSTFFYWLLWGSHIHHGLWEHDEPTRVAQIQLTERLADLAAVHRGQRLLDIGCGMGGSSIHLASTRGVHCQGVTISPLQCRWAQLSARLRRVHRQASFRCIDVEEADFPAQSVDVVWSIECTEHLFDKDRFFQHASKWVRPGGRVAICAWLAGEDLQKDDDRRQLVLDVCEGFFCPSLGTRSDYVNWLSQAGLVVETNHDWTSQVMRTWEICHQRVRRSGVRWLARWIDADTVLFLDRFETILKAYQNGAMEYGCFVARKE